MNELETAARIVQSLESHDRSADSGGASVIETHISWVLLIGRFAYKFKKPVDLGFVDFTTLDRRRFFCREELRLNRRLAPELYLDVAAITGSADDPLLEGQGKPIEYAVKMRRFRQEQLLSSLTAKGKLLPAHVQSLAREAADFHSRIEVASLDTAFGTPERVLAPVEENFGHLQRAAGDGPRRALIKRLQDWSRQEYESCRAAFEKRKRDGFVRECHGDMHLGNMLVEADRVIIFDCIEFNPSLRWIDVLSEAAFCVMDLEDRGRPDLSHRFLNDYLERTGDYAGLTVLPFYLVYRALVRAKVACLRLEQKGLDEREQAAVRDEFHSYLTLAERYTERPPPVMMITHGVSGTGKTSGTRGLVDAAGAIRIRSDVERKRLFGLSATGRPQENQVQQLYSEQTSQRTYATLRRFAQSGLQAGFSVVVDATFLKRADRDEFRSLAAQSAVPFVVLEFVATDETLRKRLHRRAQEGGDASDADISVLERQQASREGIAEDEKPYVIRVDSENPAEIEQLAARIESRRPVS